MLQLCSYAAVDQRKAAVMDTSALQGGRRVHRQGEIQQIPEPCVPEQC